MILHIKGFKYQNVDEVQCVQDFLRDDWSGSTLAKIQEDIYIRVINYIDENLATEDDFTNGVDTYEKYCTDELQYKCFCDFFDGNEVTKKVYRVYFSEG